MAKSAYFINSDKSRGFRREADRLFMKPELLKHAGLLMIDLDNLKTTNDRFGHNFGDLYIQTAGKCFVENTPEGTLCARMSGDECRSRDILNHADQPPVFFHMLRTQITYSSVRLGNTVDIAADHQR